MEPDKPGDPGGLKSAQDSFATRTTDACGQTWPWALAASPNDGPSLAHGHRGDR